ncbi:aminotransferase class IV [Archangium lansingense]|uniref:branched-chain-amino-acid transaminase n=1 Tax=Archangium lansingense TaxID=2995310 RepID=A0ABT4AHZ2_9BACT|nr:aminotransferase class IV [Archangium lansinium]MCY1081250.1 aminotransferase class IV [Archangium lansinium]
MSVVYLNGQFLPSHEARIPVDDRGFLFGDGVYEVTRALGGRLFAEEAHWRRLESGLAQLRIQPPPDFTREHVRALSERLLAENGLTGGEATVYMQVTRGAAPRTHAFPPAGTAATVYLAASSFQIPWEMRQRGVSAVTLPDLRWARCDIKTVNLLPNILAKQQAKEAGAWEAVLVRDGVVTEGASTTVMVVMEDTLFTHPKGHHILPSVTRDVVLELARDMQLHVVERPVRLDERPRWEELLLVGTTTDVQPVVSLDGQPVGEGRRGPMALQLQQALYQYMGVPWPVGD